MDNEREKKVKKSRFSKVLTFIWIIAGMLMIWALIEGLSIIIAVKKYFP